jgi:hypothetical protein
MPGEDRASSWPVPAATSSSRTARERPEICQALGGVSPSTLYRALEDAEVFCDPIMGNPNFFGRAQWAAMEALLEAAGVGRR